METEQGGCAIGDLHPLLNSELDRDTLIEQSVVV